MATDSSNITTSDKEAGDVVGDTSTLAPAEAAPRRLGLFRRDPFAFGPFRFMREFADDMDRLFDASLGRFGGELERGLGGMFWPKVELFERDGALMIRADLPGVKQDDLRVELEADALCISGERKRVGEERGETSYRSEVSYGNFERVISLPAGAVGEKAEAQFRDGVLEISVPLQAPAAATRKIEIKSRQQSGEPVKH